MTRAGGVPADYRATVPLWQRVGMSMRHELDGPFVALQAALVDSAGRSVASWNLPSLSREHPVVFFSATTLRARPARDYLEGEAWYVLRDSDFAPETDGELVAMESPRTPSGAWGRMVAEGLGLREEATSVSVAESSRSSASLRGRASPLGRFPRSCEPLTMACSPSNRRSPMSSFRRGEMLKVTPRRTSGVGVYQCEAERHRSLLRPRN
ncbi:MAG: hypothetical protein IPG47_17175 [Thermoflexaceae bacterium]|nr:hypothetical protein [Thermoflexaceae bacterium]